MARGDGTLVPSQENNLYNNLTPIDKSPVQISRDLNTNAMNFNCHGSRIEDIPPRGCEATEIDHEQTELVFSERHRPEPAWEPKYCVFTTDKRLFYFYPTEQVSYLQTQANSPPGDRQQVYTRLDGGQGCFHKHWGYRTGRKKLEHSDKLHPPSDSDLDSTSLDSSRDGTPTREVNKIFPVKSSEDFNKNFADKVEERRRESFPQENPSNETPNSISATFKLVNFFIKRGFKSNTRSASKSERKGSMPTPTEPNPPLLSSGVKSAQSHETLLTNPPGMHSIDLSDPNVDVKQLHSSVLGHGHFFHVATSQGSKYISCTTALERDKWLSSLRRTIRPQDEYCRRSDSSLKVWIVEAKNVIPKRSYFCDILLDKTLYAKTSVKTMTDMLFWGEHFEFKNLPAVETITVNFYREADRKKKKDKNLLMDDIRDIFIDCSSRLEVVDISIEFATNGASVKIAACPLQDFTINSNPRITCQLGTVGKSGKDTKSELPIIRVKARKQTVDILPLECYQSFLQHVSFDYKKLCQIFEPLLGVREKEDFATCLVHVLQKQGKACEFLSDIILEEISRLDDEHLTFRGNSIATKAMEAYMKLVGEKYLQDTLGDLIHQLVQSPDDCEVDPTKVATTQLLNCHQKNLDMYSNMAWVKVINSYCYFPTELRNVFASLRSLCNERGKVDYSDNLISGCIFLRFLCPAILYPSLFNLTQEYPNERASRNLTLIAKTIQTLANFSQFGIKEDYMTYMNSFIEKEAANMKIFLLKISSQETSNQFLTFDGDIDLGKELSVLHALLLECTEKYSEAAGNQFDELKKILAVLTSSFNNPDTGQKKTARESQIYDNLPRSSIQAQDDVQNSTNNSAASMDTTSLMSPTQLLSDMLHHCGVSTDDLPALANRPKPAGRFQGQYAAGIDASRTAGSSLTRGKLIKENTSIFSHEPAVKKMLNKPATSLLKIDDDANGDYVDLIPLLAGNTQNSTQEHKNNHTKSPPTRPLGFANPLFRLDQPVAQPRQRRLKSDDTETHYGIPVSQAQTVQRLSSDSSASSNEGGDDEPWQVNLVKTSSPLAASSPADQHFSIASLKKLTPLHSSSSDDSFNGQSVSSVGSSSYFTCSSDFIHSASESFIFPPSSMQACSPPASFMNKGAIDGCSTFPRRRAQLPPDNKADNSALLQRDASSLSPKGTDKPSPLSHGGPTFCRQLSTPGQDTVHNSNQTSRFMPNKSWIKTKQASQGQQKNVNAVKSFPRAMSSAVDSNNESQNKSIDNVSPLSSPGFTSGDCHPISGSSASSSGYSSPRVHRRQDGGNFTGNAVNARMNCSSPARSTTTTGTTNIKGVSPKPPNILTKSMGWQVAKQVERPNSLQETSSSGASSPQSPGFPTRNSMSSLHESSSAHSVSSPTTSLQSWSCTISQSDSNTSINSPTRLQQRPPAQSDSSGSLDIYSASRISQTSSSSVGSMSSGNNNLGSPFQTHSDNSHHQMNPALPAFNTRLSSRSDTQINTSFLQTKPLPQPPAFLTSKYAVVRPQTTNPTPNSRSARAASYHSSQEATKPGSRFPSGYTTSRSLDLGYLNKPTDETVISACTKSVPDQHSDQMSPTGSCANRSLVDESVVSSSNSPANSRNSLQSTVHMGINSVMRKLQEQEKTKQEYEQEVHVLRQQLLEAQERLQQTEIRLLDHEMDTQKLMDEWQNRLVESEEKIKKQQAEKEEQMKAITIRLHSIEEELKKEHVEMLNAVEHKQRVIDVQEQRIEKLNQANKRLLQALANLKGRASMGATDENSNSASACNGEFDNNEVAGFRTSSC